MPLIIIVIIIIIVYTKISPSIKINKLLYSDETLLKISKSLKNKIPLPYDFPIIKINNKKEFDNLWTDLVDKIYFYDRTRNVFAVNQWNYYVVKYYTKDVLKYGNEIQKNAFRNFVNLIDLNGLIDPYENNKDEDYELYKDEEDEEQEENNNIVIKILYILMIFGLVSSIVFYLAKYMTRN